MDNNKLKKTESADKFKLQGSESELVSYVAHQIQSPLATVKGYADLIIEGHYGKISGELGEAVERIRRVSKEAIDLTNELFGFKKGNK